jgi:hypothetical protein
LSSIEMPLCRITSCPAKDRSCGYAILQTENNGDLAAKMRGTAEFSDGGALAMPVGSWYRLVDW